MRMHLMKAYRGINPSRLGTQVALAPLLLVAILASALAQEAVPQEDLSQFTATGFWSGVPAALMAKAKAQVCASISRETVAKEMGLPWPLMRTTMTKADLEAQVEADLKEVARQKVPPFDEDACRAEFVSRHKPLKIGDTIELNLKRPGPNSRVSGIIREISPSTVRVGGRWVNANDIPDDVLSRLFPTKAEEACTRHVETKREARERECASEIARARDRVTKEAFEKAGFVSIKGIWWSDAQITQSLAGAVTSRRHRAFPDVLQRFVEEDGLVRHAGKWMDAEEARRQEAETAARMRERGEKEAAALKDMAEKAAASAAASEARAGAVPAGTPTGTGVPAKPGPGQQTASRRAAPAAPSFSHIPLSELADNLVIIEVQELGTGAKSSGSGFVCDIGGRTYVVTNQHVLATGRAFRFLTVSGNVLNPVGFEYSRTLDMVRLPLDTRPAGSRPPLTCAALAPELNSGVLVVGNSGGGGVATAISGRIQGVGPEVIETDAAFVGGNSGSPMISEIGKVLGVATYATRDGTPDWVKQGTRFTGIRRFGYRLSERTEFIEVPVSQFLRQGHLLQDIERYLLDLHQCVVLDQDFLETYVPGRTTLYYDVRWGQRIHNLITTQGLHRAATTPVTASQGATLARGIHRMIVSEVGIAMKILREEKWMSTYLHEEASTLFRMGEIIVEAENLLLARLTRAAREGSW